MMAVADQERSSFACLYVDKTSDTGADTLLAGGMARLVEQLYAEDVAHRVTIRDSGAYYQIELTPALDIPAVQAMPALQLVLPLMTADKQAKAAAKGRVIDGFDYDHHRDMRAKYAQARQVLTGKLRSPEAALYYADQLKQELGDVGEPDARLPIYDAFNAYKVGNSLNELAYAWETLPDGACQALVTALLRAFACTPNDPAYLARQWREIAKGHGLTAKDRVTQLQITNPAAGKGANQAKANGLKLGNLEELWLLELLKLAGYFPLAASVPVRTSKGTTKDRKTYILRPQQVEVGRISALMATFREVLWASTAVKLDILAVLRFTEVFLETRRRNLRDERSDPDDPTLTKLAQGFDVVFAKDMGSALATMNLSQLNLPEWLSPVESLEGTGKALALVQEHVAVIRNIGNRTPGKPNEEGAEEYELLRHYRDFLSSRNDLAAFFAFTDSYGPYVLAQRYRDRYCPQLSEEQLENLMDQSQHNLQEIIHDRGFRRIAACIRQATVGAQYRVAEQKDKRYEIRYGLGQELARSAKDDDEFVIALSRFLQSYRAENAREEEKIARILPGPITLEDRRRYRLRLNPREDDLDAVITLVSKHGSQLVCPMLLAYGYAKSKFAPRENVVDAAGGADASAMAADGGSEATEDTSSGDLDMELPG